MDPNWRVGGFHLTERISVGLFCSIRCPGAIILQAFDLAIALREAGISTVSGFQTPIEQEMLTVLLRGQQQVTVIDARGERKRIPPNWRAPIAEGRLVVISPFAEVTRPTKETARERNRLVAASARSMLVVYAAPGGETELLALDVLRDGMQVFVLAIGDANERLLSAGAVPLAEPWNESVPKLAEAMRSPL
jgi:predicted Rossmann fold nucleotide-binding protein DprA/Smf involved in DNA uptake